MGCGCRGNKPNNTNPSGGSLEQFAYLTPAQLRLREAQREAEKNLNKDKQGK